MAFTINIEKNDVRLDYETLSKRLEKEASSPKAELCWKFADNIEAPAHKAFNQLQGQVLKTDDKELITLFRRAVRNYDTTHPKEQADPVRLYNRHYQNPPFLIPYTDVKLDVKENEVEVATTLTISQISNQTSLILDALQHNVSEVLINNLAIDKSQYHVTEHEIIINGIPRDQSFKITIKSTINPFGNKSLEGLYKCKEWLTTHCESEGARRIFPTLDRPDVLSRYTCTIIADPQKYPYRISNGNFISETKDENGRSTIKWEDPFPKPSYLFATVMGDFGVLKDTFKTRSGRDVTLEVFMEKGKEKRAEYSLFALKKAMKYEEDYFDREYDLDSLKMVAMPDFNAGAMENKGLIIFNESCILVDPECATDMDYYWVAMVISHEYCHNWSGNRVTVRNWFEIALKEAFTDFRCSLFMKHKYGSELVRPHEANDIRERQYPHDASSAAHPIQVDSYITAGEIYDLTTYIKGREVFRMLKTLLDSRVKDGFRKAQNAYFDRYDGQAVTFRELLTTLQEVSGVDLTQFERWFHQPGTPTINAKMEYYSATEEVKIYFKQSCLHPKTKEEQKPFHIPLNVELIGTGGNVIIPKHLVDLTEREHVLVFRNVITSPTPVFHHDFCAPIKMEYDYSNDQLVIILQNEQDPFARKEAGDIYLKRILKGAYEQAKKSEEIIVSDSLINLYRGALLSDKLTHLAKAELFNLPSLRSIVEKDEVYNIAAAKKARSATKEKLAQELEPLLLTTLDKISEPQSYDPEDEGFSNAIGIRQLRNSCYAFLSLIAGGKHNDLIFDTYEKASNFNNRFELLNIIIELNDPRREKVLNAFFERWKHDGTILSNWIAAQTAASNCSAKVLDKIFNTEGFLKENPEHMRSLIRTFVNNLWAFHKEAEENYRYITDRILEFGEINPSVASFYLANEAFKDYTKMPPGPKALMKKELERLAAPSVDKAIRSVANKYLES